MSSNESSSARIWNALKAATKAPGGELIIILLLLAPVLFFIVFAVIALVWVVAWVFDLAGARKYP